MTDMTLIMNIVTVTCHLLWYTSTTEVGSFEKL